MYDQIDDRPPAGSHTFPRMNHRLHSDTSLLLCVVDKDKQDNSNIIGLPKTLPKSIIRFDFAEGNRNLTVDVCKRFTGTGCRASDPSRVHMGLM